FVQRGGWVLGLDLKPGHDRVLDRVIGFRSPRPARKARLSAVLIGKQVTNGVPTNVVIDVPAHFSAGKKSGWKKRRAKAVKNLARDAADAVIRRLRGRAPGIRQKSLNMSGSDARTSADNGSMPPELQHV